MQSEKNQPAPVSPWMTDRARQLHKQAIVVDAEAIALILPTVHLPPPPVNGRPWLDRAIEAGLTIMNTTLGLGGLAAGQDDLKAFLGSVYAYLAYFEKYDSQLIHVLKEEDVHRAKSEGKLGVIFGVQGIASKIDGDLTLLRVFHKLGLRVVQLTNNDRNSMGCGAMEPNDTGLTLLGKACVRELNHLGIVVDAAHAGETTARELIETSSKPCIISHANVRSLVQNSRNVTDGVLRALAEKGGVIGITALAQFSQRQRGLVPTVNDMVDHISYVADLVGVDHVGIGSDLQDIGYSEIRHDDFVRFYPEMEGDFHFDQTFTKGFERVEHFPRLTEALVERGFRDDEVLKILGGNLCRVFRANWG